MSGSDVSPDARGPEPRRETRTSRFEWGVGALGLALVIATVAFLLVDATRSAASPPQITIRAESVVALGTGGYLVPFVAENRGGETAANVDVVGELRETAATETSRAHVDYLPGRSQRRGGLFFTRDPRRATMSLRAEGYQAP